MKNYKVQTKYSNINHFFDKDVIQSWRVFNLTLLPQMRTFFRYQISLLYSI